jgi:Concanavalin A-like lectin/glucanases superfamily
LRASSAWATRLCALALAAGGCSGTTIVAVDPYPCVDGGATVTCGPGLLDGLIGWWHLNDASGSTTARDWSSWGNTGTLDGLDAANVWAAGGPAGGSLAVDGKGYVNVPASSSIDSITNAVTVTAWVRLEQTNTDFATAISRQIGTGYGQLYHLSISPKQLAALYITNPTDLVFLTSPSPMPLQTWIHLAGTWDGAEARLYVNGAEVASGPLPGPFGAETNPVVLSGNGNGPDKTVGEFIPGRLAEVMLYRRALSANDILRLKEGALLPAAFHPDGGG